jgi:hypothetical protein
VWWYIPLIPVIGKLRQEDLKFKVNLGNLASSRPAWAT